MRVASTSSLWVSLALAAVLVAAHLARPAPVSAGTTVSADVFGAAGGDGQGSSYVANDTFGQYPIDPEPASDGKELRDGFWATLGMRSPDTTPPELAVSVFQNPYITEHLDIYLIASEALTDSSVTLNIGTTDVSMEENNATENIWRGDYDLCCTGTLSIKAWARDLSLNRGSRTRSFSSSMVLASSGGIAASPDLRLEVRFPGGVVKKDAYVLVFDSREDGAADNSLYSLSPTGLELNGFVEIAVTYPEATGDPEHLSIATLDGGVLVPVDSYLDKDRGRLLTYANRLGTYGLMSVPDRTTPAYGVAGFKVSQNAPNPFVNSTRMDFEVAREGRVTIEILSVDGRIVRSLLDASVIPGKHAIDWDGCDVNGSPVAAGVYLCKARFGTETVTHKIVRLH